MIPNNWHLATLGEIAKLQTGSSINDKVKKEKYLGKSEGLTYIATKDISFNNEIDYNTNIKIPESDGYKIAPANTALLCIEGGSAGRKLGFTNQPVCYVNKLCAFITVDVHSKFVYYFLQTLDFITQFKARKHGLIGGVPLKSLSTINIPIPPIDEQERIVKYLDSLLTKLNRSRVIAQNIVDGYELRRGKLLHETFKGELIKCNPQQMTIKSVCKSLMYGTSKKSDKSGKVIVIRMGNLQGGEIDWSNLAYSNDEEEIKKYHLSAGDVLFNRTNSAELVGKTSIYRGEYPAIYAGYLIKLDYDPNIIVGDYLNYILNSPEAKDYCHRVKTDGVNQSNINAKRIGAFEIPVPNLEEQKEIVRHLDSLLTKELRNKELAESVLNRIEKMKKKILGMAFRGELI